MSNLNRDFVEDTDNKVWEPPERDYHTSIYFKPDTVLLELPKAPNAWIEADAAYNLEDMK